MSTRITRSWLVLSSLSVLACAPPQLVCPDGFTLSPEGRCVAGDAGTVVPIGDGAVSPDAGSDAGSDAATAAIDGGVPGVDAYVEGVDAFVPLPDAFVEQPDAYVVPTDAYLAPDACAFGTWYVDADHDGYGGTTAISGCSQPAGTVSNTTDCDDANAARHPAATELCNGVDDNCDGAVDEGVTSTWFFDGDGDGHGRATDHMTACSMPAHYVPTSDDCDDSRASVYPGAVEICDGLDNNCNETVDEGVRMTFYLDGDHDGYGSALTTSACAAPSGYTALGGDCVDTNASIHPNAVEICDFVDQDCNGVVDDGLQIAYFPDCDGDTYAAAGATATYACPSANPTTAVPCVGGLWTSLAPTSTGTTDCADQQPLAYPGSRHVDSARAWSGAFGVGHWDWNCDGVDTPTITSTSGLAASCGLFGTPVATCHATGQNWTTSYIPHCGDTATLHSCTFSPCAAATIQAQQACY